MLHPTSKIFTPDAALKWRGKLAASNRRLVVTNGCFDILHRGHADYLYKARLQGDALMVLINSDASVHALKGPSRPLNKEEDRAYILGSLFFVDAVVVFGEERCTKLFTLLKPDIYVKGADYNIDTINKEEKSALLAVGADIRFIELTPGFSTSGIIASMT